MHASEPFHALLKMSLKLTATANLESDRIYEGLRIPASLDNTLAVNFVLTQEPGKLKPKDLKNAIERSRAERELRAEEQRKIREEGGGAGLLDLRGILAEERQNASDADPFQRQLRELAFLADVDEVDKQETEKSFRVSEDYLGSDLLSADDIEVVKRQRAKASLYKLKSSWRNVQARQVTGHYGASHPSIKAGVSAETGKLMLATLKPAFDPNRNDIWGKRLNTLRRFITLVSKWLIRKRVSDRIKRILTVFHTNGAYSREQVLQFIIHENILYKKQGATQSGKTQDISMKDGTLKKGGPQNQPKSVSVMIFSSKSEVLRKREEIETTISTSSINVVGVDMFFTHDMVRRVLFPRCNAKNGGKENRKELLASDIGKPITFDDRTVFQLKVKPDYITMEYKPHTIPIAPTYLPACSDTSLRRGAFEENAKRPSADTELASGELEKLLASATNSQFISQFCGNSVGEEQTKAKVDDASVMPAWMNNEFTWSTERTNYFKPQAKYRKFIAAPRWAEIDPDWSLRPFGSEKLSFLPDNSLRTR